jgi:hypothetical protein
MSNLFWNIYLGVVLGTITVNLFNAIIDEYRARRRHSHFLDVLDRIEELDTDIEFEEDDEDED